METTKDASITMASDRIDQSHGIDSKSFERDKQITLRNRPELDCGEPVSTFPSSRTEASLFQVESPECGQDARISYVEHYCAEPLTLLRTMLSNNAFSESSMPDFRLPLGGDVVQSIAPWTSFFSNLGNNFNFLSLNLGRSSNPDVEQEILAEVASYGKQLGRIGDALAVLVTHFKPDRDLTPDEAEALHELKRLLDDIAKVKARNAERRDESRRARA
jgi:hypothetical protein